MNRLLLALVAAILLAPFPVRSAVAQPRALEVVKVGLPVVKPLALVSTQPAKIEPLEQTALYSRVSAYVAGISVDYGDRVKKGDPLVSLSAPELTADFAQKQALAGQAEAEQAQAEAGVAAAITALEALAARRKQAEAEIARAEADVSRWKSELARVEQLVASGVVSRTLADEAQQKFASAAALLQQAKASADAADASQKQGEAEVQKARADVKAAAAKVKVAEAAVAHAQAFLGYLTLTAPFDGVIVSRKVDPGRLVQATAGEPLLVIARTDQLRAVVHIPEAEAPQVDKDDSVTLEFPNLRGLAVTAQVSRTSGVLDESSRSLLVLVDLPNEKQTLRPGLFCTAKVTLAQRETALTLPAAAVVRQGREAFCYRLVDGKAQKTPLELGLRVGDDWEIVGGLAKEVQVILNKANSLSDGQAVEPAR